MLPIYPMTKIVVAPAPDTNIYASGDLIGAKLTLIPAVSGGLAGVIRAVSLVDQAKQNAAIDILFFDDDPSGTTFTNNAAIDIADADMTKLVGFAQIPATSGYAAFNDNNLGQAQNLFIPFVLDDGKALYAALVSRGTPTFAATTDLSLNVLVEKHP